MWTGFKCKPGNITQCQCYGFMISEELKAYFEQRYIECLCRNCLEYLSVELNCFKENIFSDNYFCKNQRLCNSISRNFLH